MSRAIALCFLLLAAVIGFLHIDSRPVWAPFQNTDIPAVELAVDDVASNIQLASKASIHGMVAPQSNWLPDTGAPSVHAASLIGLKDGAIRAFWFAGSREGAPDVVINSAVFDPHTSLWSAPTVVMDRVGAEKGLSRYVAKLGNPVPSRMADGRIQLFFVTVSIGGWAGSSISSVISDDEGLTWGRPQRLITSPWFNLSTLVKSPAVQFTDGRLGLPAYHEWIGRFGEFLRVEAGQVIDKRRMSSGRSAIQPVLFVEDPQAATAYFRQTRSSSQIKQIPVSLTANAGQTWQQSDDITIANPNSAVAGLTLKNGIRLLALNNIEAGRYRLVLLMKSPQSAQWHLVQTLEDDEILSNELRKEYSYPYLISVDGQDAHLVYTWNRQKIKHLYFPSTWIMNSYKQLPVASTPEAQEEAKEVRP